MSLAESLTRLIRPSSQTVRGRRRIASSIFFLRFARYSRTEYFTMNSLKQKHAQTLSLPDRSPHIFAMQNPNARRHAETLDATDPLRDLRAKFLTPQHSGRDQLYFCGNSLGLQPVGARA